MKRTGKEKTSFFKTLFLLIIIFCVFSFIIISPHMPTNRATESQVITVTPTPTALPDNYPVLIREYFENENETDGLIIGGSVLLVIVLLGILISKRNNEK